MFYRRIREKKLNRIELMLMLLFAVYYILPSMSLQISFLVPAFVGTAYTLYLCCKNTRFGIVAVKLLAIIVFLSLLYTLFSEGTSIAQGVSNRLLKRFLAKYYQLLMMYFPAAMFWRIHMCGSLKQKKLMLYAAFAIIGYVTVVTHQEIVINQNATRAWGAFAELGLKNVGGYYFVYCIPVVIPLMFMLWYAARRRWQKAALLMSIVGLFVFVMESQYTLALLMAVVAATIVLFKGVWDTRTKAVFLVLGISVLLFLPHLLHWLSTVVPSEQMSIRLYEVYAFLWHRDTTGYNLMGRLGLYWEAVKAFARSPLWGNRHLTFDGHATLLMVLADLGILGGIPFYYVFFSMRKEVGKVLGDLSSEFTPIFLVLVIMGFTNPITAAFPTAYTVWFVAPLLIEVLNPRKGIKSDERMAN